MKILSAIFYFALFIFCFAWLYFMYLAYAIYDTHENSKKRCHKLIQLIEERKFKHAYDFLDHNTKKKYASVEYSNLIKTVKNENTCINYKCSKVNSGDNFNLILTSCNSNTALLVITFGGGFGFGWQVINIRKNL